MAERKIPYSIVDVFTDTPFLGNPLAVIHDASGLTQVEMHSIALEFGFSESTFILPPKSESYAAQVKIFTPMEEIPFAGHPNIGTAFTLATQDTAARDSADKRFVFAELGGDVFVQLEYENGEPAGAKIVAPQGVDVIGACEPELMAKCLGLSVDQLSPHAPGPCVASVGLPFAFVAVTDLDALSNITLSAQHFEQARVAGPETVDGFAICAYVLVDQGDNEMSLRSRVFSPLGMPAEDPATGSASGALAALLAPSQRETDFHVQIRQGVEMGRASQISVTLKADSDCPVIAGSCVTISTGTLHL